MLPSEDRVFLSGAFPGFSDQEENQMWCVVLPGFRLPEGLTEPAADLLLRLAPGYPDIPPDMWWFSPAVCRIDGRDIPQTQVEERYLRPDLAALVPAPSSRCVEPGNRWARGISGARTPRTARRRGVIPLRKL